MAGFIANAHLNQEEEPSPRVMELGIHLAFWTLGPPPQPEGETPSSPSEKHGWRVLGGMMGPVQ